MKSSVAALGMFAALASAHNHIHFPRGNTTTAAGDSVTTLTVLATEVSTIISCAPTVTNCPADQTAMSMIPESDRSTMVVTNTIKLTETVCPVSEAPHISASVISNHNSGKVTGTTVTTALTPTMPATNGGGVTTSEVAAETASTPVQSASGSFTTSTMDIVTDKTMTMTLGTGSDTTVVATVVKATIKSTVTVPCDQATATGTAGDNEPTTTTTATSTSTKTITVAKPTKTGTSPSGPDSTGEACDCSCASTVTVTAPASTVYITMGADATKTDSGDQPTVTDKSDNGSSGGDNGGDDSTKAPETTDCPDQTTTLEATVTVVPYPTGNGTAPMTSGAANPSGFARLRR